jgi:hypothetical protein
MKRLGPILLLLAACQSTSPSGFLADYRKLRPNPAAKNQLTWFKPGIDLREYDQLMIDPVEVHLNPDSEAGAIGEATLQKAADAFRDIMIETIEPYYTVVTEPGPHVLRVRAALTDVQPAGRDVQVGTAALEAELLDPDTGARLAAVVDRISSGGSGARPPKEWRSVEGAYREWARRLLEFMDSHRG